MTLIAGFRSYGTPTLIGDLLITANGQPTGLRSKLRRIRQNFVFAWTGNLLAAEQLAVALHSALPDRPVRLADVEAVLKVNSEARDFGSLEVTIIGWVAEDGAEAECFKWSSGYPDEIFYGPTMFDGSGAAAAQALIGDGFRAGPGVESGSRQDVVAALYGIGQLIRPELLGNADYAEGFGVAYEVLLMDTHGRFRYVDSILYCSLVVPFDAAGEPGEVGYIGKFYKYDRTRGFPVLHIYEPASKAVTLQEIREVGVPRPPDASASLPSYTYPFASAYYCPLIYLVGPDGWVQHLAGVWVGGEGSQAARVEGGTLQLKIPREMLRQGYRSIRADQEARSGLVRVDYESKTLALLKRGFAPPVQTPVTCESTCESRANPTTANDSQRRD